MPARRRGVARVTHELTLQEDFELLIWMGGRPSHFRDDAEREAAWHHHRERLMELPPAGARPAAWWHYEQREPEWANATNQAVRLKELGLD